MAFVQHLLALYAAFIGPTLHPCNSYRFRPIIALFRRSNPGFLKYEPLETCLLYNVAYTGRRTLVDVPRSIVRRNRLGKYCCVNLSVP